MRVLLTTPTYPPFNSGLGNAVHRHALGLVKHGFEVVLATGGQERSSEVVDGVRIERFAVTGADYLRNPIRGDVEGYRDFLLTERYDTIVMEAWQTWSTDIALQLADRLKARKFLYSHCVSTNSWLPYMPVRSLAFYMLWRPYWWTIKHKIAKLDGMIFLADGGSDDRFDDLAAARKVGLPIHVLPNSCQDDAFDLPKTERDQIISVGSYTPAKGFDYVLEAYARSKAKNVIPLALFGQEHTAHSDSLRRQAGAFGLEPSFVRFNSGVAGLSLLQQYARSRLFISGSYTECQPLVLLDAMATGTPFVARSTGCIAGMPGGQAVVSVTEAAETIDRLLLNSDDWTRYRAAGLQAARTTYAEERNSALLADLLKADQSRAISLSAIDLPPLVTTATPVFSGGPLLRAALTSIIEQNFDDRKLILIDDGSSDGAIAALPAILDSRIHIMSDGTNRGLAARLNQTIGMARGNTSRGWTKTISPILSALKDRYDIWKPIRQRIFWAPTREPGQRNARRRLLRQGRSHHQTTRKDQTTNHPTSALAAPQHRRITSTPRRGRHYANPRSKLSQMIRRRTGSGTDLTILELTRLIARVLGFEGKIVLDLSKLDGTRRKLMSAGKLHGMGWEPSIDLEERIAATDRWFLVNLNISGC